MEHALRLPKLNLGGAFASGASAATPKFLDPIEPPTFPFTSPGWSLPQKPRSIALLDVFKNHELLTTYTVDQKAVYLIGRNAVVCDIVLNHCSISRLHAAVIHHKDGAAYLVDLGSCHGTFVDDVRLKPLQPTLIVHGSTLKFGASSRSYSFKSFESHDEIIERVQSRIELDPDEMEVEQNTLLNRALSYRLGFSIPHSHKADAEGDDPMALFPTRQMEASTSASSMIRRTQSEDNTIASTFPLCPQSTTTTQSSALVAARQAEPGRKRSRTQSAGVPISTTSPPHATAEDPAYDQDADVVCKRVHFSEQPAETIPERVVFYSPEQTPASSPLLLGVATPSASTSPPHPPVQPLRLDVPPPLDISIIDKPENDARRPSSSTVPSVACNSEAALHLRQEQASHEAAS